MDAIPADELIGAIYDAAHAPELWSRVLHAMMLSLQGTAGTLMVQDNSDGPARISYMTYHGFGGSSERAYHQYYAAIDTRVAGLAVLRPGDILVDGLTLDYAATMRTEAWQDFYRPAGVGGGMGMRLSALGGGAAMLTFQRPLDGPLYGPEDGVLLRRYGAHVDRALRLQRHLGMAQDVRHALRQGLDRFPMPVLLLGTELALVELNAAAATLLALHDQPLRCVAQHLAAVRPADADALRRLLTEAARSLRGAAPPPPLVLRTADPERPLTVLAVPVGERTAARPPGAQDLVLLFVSRRGPVQVDRALLAAEFGLTGAEAAVAAFLLAGVRVPEIAAARNSSSETVLAQIRSVLHKTGAGSQTQLVSLLGQGLARLLRP